MRPAAMVSSSGAEATELAARCGLILDVWQAEALEDGLAERQDGSWAASDVVCIASRQNGKNAILEARELFGAVVLGEHIIHTAHLFPTARESFRRLMGLLEGHPDVRNELIQSYASPMSGYDMRFRSGGRVQFIARSRTSGRGLTGDVLVCDEAQDLADEALGALLPTISARPNSQAWYSGSAPGMDSIVLHRFRARGRAGIPGRYSYRELSADPDANLDDRDAWAQANLAYPHRISDETIMSERATMSDEMFARERLSISPDLLEAGGIFGPAWDKICSPDVMIGPKPILGIDANPERTHAAIVAADKEGNVELVEYRQGMDWLVARATELAKTHKCQVAVDGAGPAGSFVPQLKAANVRVTEVKGQSLTAACGQFYDAVLAAHIHVRTSHELSAAAAAGRQRPSGDAWTWGRKASAADISPLVAATVAAYVARGRGRHTFATFA